MNLQYEFITLRRSMSPYLLPREQSTLESAGITLFDLRPVTRAEELTGMHLLKVALEEVLARNDVRAAEPLLAFYEKAAEHYKVSAEVRAPSPLASEVQGAAAQSAQRGTRQGA